MKGDPQQVLDVLRDVMLEHMDSDGFGPWFRPQTAVLVGKYSGTHASALPAMEDGAPEPLVLLVTMRDGSEYRLTLDWAVQ